MKIYIGADHRGFELKRKIIVLLNQLGYEAVDVGSYDEGVMCDYPKISYAVGTAVAASRNKARGILVCMTGLGHAIAANKIPGILATVCYNRETAALSRQHNNANVLVLGARFVTEAQMYDIVKIWLESKFEGGRHLRRVNQIRKIEREFLCKKKK